MSVDIDLLFRKSSSKLRAFISRRIYRPEDVEDVMQETFLRAFRGSENFRGDAKPETWLLTIATNTMNSLYHDAKRHSAVEYMDELESSDDAMADMGEPHESPLDYVMRLEKLERMAVVIDALPVEFHSAINLIANEGCQYDEAAQILDIPIGTIRSRLFRARAMIKADPLLKEMK